jgi:hypothetical protein
LGEGVIKKVLWRGDRKVKKELTMSKFKHFWIVLVALAPLTASGVNAQQFGAPIDILGPVQEDIIRDVKQNPDPTRSRGSSTIRYSSVSPKFMKALRECDNDYISGFITARRVVEDVLFIHPQLLQRARQCGAISSKRLEELLSYQQGHSQHHQTRVTRPNTNAPRPRSTSPNCDNAIENVMNAVEAVETSTSSSSVSSQLQKVQQANQLMAEQCKGY